MATIPMAGFTVPAVYNASVSRQKTQSNVNDSPPFAQFAAKETNQGRPATGREKERLFRAIIKNDSQSAAQDAKGKTAVQLPQKQEQRANVVHPVEKDNQTSTTQSQVNSGRTIQDDIQSAITRGVMAALVVIKNTNTETATSGGQAAGSQTGMEGTQTTPNLTVGMPSVVSAVFSMGGQAPPQNLANTQPLITDEEQARLAEAQTRTQGTIDALLASLEKIDGNELDASLVKTAMEALKSLQNAGATSNAAVNQLKQVLTDIMQKAAGSGSQNLVQSSGQENSNPGDASKIKSADGSLSSINPSLTREIKSISVNGSSNSTGQQATQQNQTDSSNAQSMNSQSSGTQSSVTEGENVSQTSSSSSARLLFAKTLREAGAHVEETASTQSSQNMAKGVQSGNKPVLDTVETTTSLKAASSQTKAKEGDVVEMKASVQSQDSQAIGISMPAIQRADAATKTAELSSTQNILSQTLRNVDEMVQNGQKSLRVQLNPENLGGLELRLTSQNGSLQVVILADSSMTQQVLERHARDLQQLLVQSGVNLAGLTVGQRGANESNAGSNSRSSKQSHFTGGQTLAEDALEGIDSHLRQSEQNVYYQYSNTADYTSPYVDYRV